VSRSLAERREALVARSQKERAAILAAAEPLVRKAAAADRLYLRVRRHPVTVALVGTAVVALGARKLFDLATRVMAIYALFRR